MATAFAQVASVEPEPLTDEVMQERLSGLVSNLQAKADEQVRRKVQDVEQRWLEDLRAFHGRYDPKVAGDLTTAHKSSAFVKITRKKTNSWEARLSALLFPTDEENWDIRPTPVSTLHQAAKDAVENAAKQVKQANEMASQDPAQAQALAQGAQAELDDATLAADMAREASKRCDAMRKEMQDQLLECDYPAECRLQLRDGCRIGTGITKGPMSGEHATGKWFQIEGEYVYKRESDPAPIYRWVNPWSYFPDMSALRPEDIEFEFERHLWSAKDLRKLVRERGFNPQAVSELIENSPRNRPLTETGLNYIAELRSIGETSDVITNRFVGWEYHGPLTCEELAIVFRALGKDDLAAEYETDPDHLKEIRVICYFCEGKLLKMSPAYPLDSGETLYSMFTFEENEGSLFGYGVPRIMRDSQKAMNGAWRMALDNAALSVGPQIFIDRESITPANNEWEVTPRKLWFKRKGVMLGQGPVMEIQNIPNNVTEIMNIVETSRRFIDDETALPVQAEGELTDNPNITATATNFMSMASNVTFRRVVKNFDDNVTAPSIRRLYDWNMQHNSRDDIKGDMKVDARGSTYLLQREMQSQMLLNIAQNWSQHPLLGKAIKPYKAIVETLRSSMIQPEMIMATEEEFEAALAKEEQAAQQQQPDPTVTAAETRLKAAQVDADARIKVAEMQRQTEMIKLAQNYNISVERLKTMLDMKELDHQHKERVVAVEAAMEQRRAVAATAKGEEPPQSGGYI